MVCMVKNFIPQGGKHCITNALKQLFAFYGCPLSEDMLFGLGAGLAFVYVNTPAMPMVSGRSHVFDFEKQLAQRLGVSIKCRQPSNADIAREKAIGMLQKGQPVLVYADMPFMNYLSLGENNHFGGHAIVLAGYDGERRDFFVSDRDNHDYPIRTPAGDISSDLHEVSFDELEAARSSGFRPFPAHNRYVEPELSGFHGVTPEMCASAIRQVCGVMLNPAAKLLGVSGIEKFSREIKKWSKFDEKALKNAGTGNYFMINGDGGTGGGMFRSMYGGFLKEAGVIMNESGLNALGCGFEALAGRWDGLADDLWVLGETGDASMLGAMSQKIAAMAETEMELHKKALALV